MRVFKLKKGGETENVDEAIVILSRPIDEELIKKAINICAEKNYDLLETECYLENQFNCVDVVENDDLKTFYC